MRLCGNECQQVLNHLEVGKVWTHHLKAEFQPSTTTTAEMQPTPSSQQEATIAAPTWKKYVNAFLAAELSTLTRYYDCVIQWLPRENDTGMLFAAIDAPLKQTLRSGDPFPDLSNEHERRTVVLVNGSFNHEFDIQGRLLQLKPRLSRTSRVVALLYNPYLRWLYNLANRLGIRKGELPNTFLTRIDLQNIVKVAGYEIVRFRLAVYFTWKLLGLGDVINRVLPMIPVARWFSFTSIVVLRSLVSTSRPEPSSLIRRRRSCK